MFNSDRIQRDYVTFSYVLVEMLKEMGHVVDHRRINIGEEIGYCYDYAFCGVAPLSSITSGRVPETHYVMDQMPGRHAVYADDWSFCGFGNSVRYSLEKWEGYLKYKNFPYDPKALEVTKKSLQRMMNLPDAPVLAPMFPWGKHSMLMENNYEATLWTIDPSPWVKFPDIQVPEVSNKKIQWVMAALSDHTPWIRKQKFSLPITYVGNARMHSGVVLKEDAVVQLFADSYGALSVGYPSAGSGWWRTRYLNAAWGETLIYCDSKDQITMGASYQGTAEYFENLSSQSEYASAVQSQISWLNNSIGTKETAINKLKRLIKE
jgi:hypothetical protein